MSVLFGENHFRDNGVTAHRGDSTHHPENTLAAFAAGIEIGADWLELDVHRTRDGALVVIHDHDTERVCGERRVVAESTLAELQTLNASVGFNRSAAMPHSPTRIPTLEDVLQLVMAQPAGPRIRVSIQPKAPDIEQQLAAAVRDVAAEEHVGFNDGNFALLARCQQLVPAARIFWDLFCSDADLTTAADLGWHGIVAFHEAISTELVRRVSDAGLEMGALTRTGTV